MRTLMFVLILSTIFIPIAFNSETYDTAFLKCEYILEDSWGVDAGTVTSWIQVEYHPTGIVRLKEFFDKYEPNPTYQFTYFKWYGVPKTSLFEINHLWTDPPIIDWQFTYTETISAWEAVTGIGYEQSYTLNSLAFRKGHKNYPIRCVQVPLDDDDED